MPGQGKTSLPHLWISSDIVLGRPTEQDSFDLSHSCPQLLQNLHFHSYSIPGQYNVSVINGVM